MKNRLLTALLALLLSCCIAIGPTAALAGVYALPLSWGTPVLCWAVSFLLGLLLGVLLSPGSCGSTRQDGGEPPQ